MITIAQDVERALAEDLGSGDVTSALLPPKLSVNAEILTREAMLMCGQPWVNAVFAAIDPAVLINWCVAEGEWLANPTVLCRISGLGRSVLTAERTALNFLQTLAGTATQTYHYVERLKGYPTRLLDTRKTIPGLRLAQKYAVRLAGAMNHRMGLYDAFLIKENHIRACGSILAAVALAREAQLGLLIEVEVETLQELEQAIVAQPDRIMLDNFSLEMIVEAVAMRQNMPCKLEVSGGVGLSNLTQIAETGVDFISVGAITKSVRAIDLSLLVRNVA